ncbi:MAG: S41 family peptidase [Patescibacteria group bacterium]
MKTLPFAKIRLIVISLALLLLVGGIGYQLGERRVFSPVAPGGSATILNQNPPAQFGLDFGLFWDVWGRLFRYYIDAKSLEPQKMIWGAISGMVNSLGDPYTVFLPPKENKDFKEDLGGAFEGIGAQLGTRDNRIIVVAPLKGTPAEKAGLRAGDWIMKVNEEETAGWTVQQAVSKIRGPRGTKVKLTLLHEQAQKPLELEIVRDTITIPSVEFWVKTPGEITEISGLAETQALVRRNEKVAYLRLTRFGDHTSDEWAKAVGQVLTAQAANGKLKGLIFDLRNNPGGYLDGSVFIASEFLGSGVVVSQVNSDGTRQDYPVNRRGRLLDIPLVVLINKGSASASEIVAGALRDYKRATLVGEISFGKGSVQTPQDLPGGAGLHITTAKWLLPKGDSINKSGVKPDIEVKFENGLEATRDAQLAKAVELLLK